MASPLESRLKFPFDNVHALPETGTSVCADSRTDKYTHSEKPHHKYSPMDIATKKSVKLQHVSSNPKDTVMGIRFAKQYSVKQLLFL